MTADDRVWVLDSSALIRIKTEVPQKEQWSLFKRLEGLVESGVITFPKLVRDEMDNLDHPDAPGVWAVGVYGSIQYPGEPAIGFVRQVMASPAADVVDPDKATDDADPYVIALGLHLIDAGFDACVVTDDRRAHPTHIGLGPACDHVSVPWCTLVEFLLDLDAG